MLLNMAFMCTASSCVFSKVTCCCCCLLFILLVSVSDVWGELTRCSCCCWTCCDSLLSCCCWCCCCCFGLTSRSLAQNSSEYGSSPASSKLNVAALLISSDVLRQSCSWTEGKEEMSKFGALLSVSSIYETFCRTKQWMAAT